MTEERKIQLEPLGLAIRNMRLEQLTDYIVDNQEEAKTKLFISKYEQEAYFVGEMPIIGPAQRYRLVPKEALGDKDRLREALKDQNMIVSLNHVESLNGLTIDDKIKAKIKEIENG